MKKSICLLLCMVMSMLVLCSCGNKKNTNTVSGITTSVPPYGSRRVVAFGDSIAAGYGLSEQSDNYLNIFCSNIGATLTNNAVSGYDSDDLLKHLKSGKPTRDIQNADIIVLSIGSNDLIHQSDLLISTLKESKLKTSKLFPEKIENIYKQFEKNLSECIAIIRSFNPGCTIIIQTVYNPVLKQGYKISIINVAKVVDKYIVRLNESIFAVCNTLTNVCVFDIADEMNQDENNFYDAAEEFDIHPTAYGHKSLAEIYTSDFNQLISR